MNPLTTPVALLDMPFGLSSAPSIGISLLKSALHQQGFGCDVFYFGLTYAAQVGFETYERITEQPHLFFTLAGEWLFAPVLFGENIQADDQYIKDILNQENGFFVKPFEALELLRLREISAGFIHNCLESTDWSQYKIVGFSTSFNQNVASLALARQIKARHPDVMIAFGGANCMGEMGAALLRLFPFIDFVCYGEGDISFPALVQAVLKGQPHTPIPNMLYQNDAAPAVKPHGSTLIMDLDSLPYPDFDDYYIQIEKTGLSHAFQPHTPLETSRGCWWGQKHPCVFCGFNGPKLTFRSKTPARVLDEIKFFKAKHGQGTLHICVVDNILDYHYFDTLLPELAAASLEVDFFWEVKANLKREQVAILAEAGVRWIQPGIESLSDAVLRLMNKGTTRLQNIQTLKWCKQFGINVTWNLLYGFPGEDLAEYVTMLQRMPLLFHLEAPRICTHIIFKRFSSHFKTPAAYGITRLTPKKAYQYIFHPFDESDLMSLVNYFDAAYADKSAEYSQWLFQVVDEWQAHQDARLDVYSSGASIRIVDTRQPDDSKEYVFDGLAAQVYLLCDEIKSAASILDAFNHSAEANGAMVQAILDDFVGKGLMVWEGKSYLSLAVTGTAIHRTGVI